VIYEADWEEPLEKYGVNLVLIDEGSALATVLKEHPGWKRVYADELAVVFVRVP